jgi:hypothetical protein
MSTQPWLLSLPVFEARGTLSPAWGRYLRYVYGTVADLPFPFSLQRLGFFYLSELPVRSRPSARMLLGLSSSNVSLLQPADALIPTMIPRSARGRYSGRKHQDLYTLYPTEVSKHSMAFVYRSGEEAVSLGVPDGGLAEVIHCFEDLDDYWMYLAVGSGIYFNVGRTAVARNALELATRLNVTMQIEVSTRRFPRCWRVRRCVRACSSEVVTTYIYSHTAHDPSRATQAARIRVCHGPGVDASLISPASADVSAACSSWVPLRAAHSYGGARHLQVRDHRSPAARS